MTQSQILKTYKPHDKYFGINENDKSLTPIYISLPEPPSLKLIDGYGLPIQEQFFRRHIMPVKLKNLESKVYKELKNSFEENSKKTITGAKIINKYWEILENNQEYYAEEIKYIEKVIWHCIHGYWFFCYGKPTYISPWHYEILNFWYNPDIQGGYFEYRDRDRIKMLFEHYCYTTTESFKNIDQNGNAIKTNGVYEMVDLYRRTSFGTCKPKNRRSGETHQGICIVWAIIRKTIGGVGTIISKTGEDARKYWIEKFLPAWQAYPLYLKPLWNGTNSPNSLKLKAPDNDFYSDSLDSLLYPTESADEVANDGGKLYAILSDEQAKVPAKSIKISIIKRFYINKLTLCQGLNIHGYCTNPSTVEEMNEGGDAYQELCEQSNFYKRLPSGQTQSGVSLMFAPAQIGFEGFIDPWGNSVIENPSKELIQDTFDFCKKHNVHKKRFSYLNGKGSYETLLNERDAILREDTPRSRANYRSLKRKQPMCYDDCWGGGVGDLGLNVELVNNRMAELRRNNRKDEKRGYFNWKYGPDSEVEFVSDANGSWVLTEDIPEHLKNQFILTNGESYETGEMLTYFEPRYPSNYTLGADPFGYHDHLVESRGSSKSSGGAGLLKEKLESDKNKPIQECEGFVFIGSYLGDTTQYDFDEQMLMCCVYTGAMLFLERNKESTWRHMIDRGYRGYLKYEYDYEKQKYKDRPGYYLTDKSELFKLLEFYIDKRIHKDKLYDFLNDIITIKDIKQLTKFDRLAGHLAALRGSNSKQGVFIQRQSNESFDIGAILNI